MARFGGEGDGVFHLGQFTDYGLLFVRIMVGVIFADSDLKDPDARSKSIGTPKNFTIFLGVAEVLGGIAVVIGILTQLASIGLILIMGGALAKKAFVWKTGFWGKSGLGWNYELLLISILCVILFSDGGGFTLSGLVGWNK
jgi:putative oxidoreductase